MKVVVTGGAGFIGANLVRRLVDEPGIDAVAVVDDLSTGLKSNLAGVEGASLFEGTILDGALLDEVFDGAKAVVHLAALPSVPRSVEDPVATHEVNASGTLQVLEAARRAGDAHVIVASSSSVYGANPGLPKSEDLRLEPLSPYAVSKVAAEAYAMSHAHCYGLPVLAFRFFNVFGPLQPAGHAYAAVIPAFISAALARRPLPLHGDGRQTRDFTFVGSVTDVITSAVLNATTSMNPVNLAFGSRRSLLQVIRDIESVLGYEVEVEHLPARRGDVSHSQADQARLRALLPQAEPTGFEEGLQRTIDWFRSTTG